MENKIQKTETPSPEVEKALSIEREQKAAELLNERNLKINELNAERDLKTKELLAERSLKARQLADKDVIIAQKDALILKLEQEIEGFKGMGFLKRLLYK
jgi:arsenate reductase-like glutaredoxin family protein